jgi:hypothetical protein
MELKHVEKVNEMSEKATTSESLAAYIIANDTNLSRRIIQDWLDVAWKYWQKFYDPLTKHPEEGHLAGPTPAQARILKRMCEKGHKIAPVRGMFRWTEGNDVTIFRATMRVMIEKGWLRMSNTTIPGLEYILEPTELGKFVLANYDLDREERIHAL